MEKDHFEALIDACIKSYCILYNDKLALDYNMVTGKMRSLILEDSRYIKETRSAYAKRMVEEVNEINNFIAQDVESAEEDDADFYDPRNASNKKLKKQQVIDKEFLTMRFKALQARRELLSLSASEESKDESEGINFFFVPVDKDEFEKLAVVEIVEGDADSANVIAGEANKDKETPDVKGAKKAAYDDDLYILDEDGNIIGMAEDE